MFFLGILLLFFLLSSPSFSQTDPTENSVWETLNVTGSIRGGYFSASRNLDNERNLITGSSWLRLAPKINGNILLVAEGWVRNDESFRHDATRGRLREGYLDFSVGDADFRIGKQIIVWGRADEINPTDTLSPRDYTLLTTAVSDQRLGVSALKVTYHLRDYSLTGIWLPGFSASTFPLVAAPGTYFTKHADRGGQAAVKFNRSGGEVDWSVSYFNGFDLNPDIRIGALDSMGQNLVLMNHRIHVLGMDAATVMGQYGLRAEAAYTWTSYDADSEPLVKKPFLYIVAGGDRTFLDNFNVNLQYLIRYISHYQDPYSVTDPFFRQVAIQNAVISNQADHFQHGISFRISKKWLNETLEGEASGVFSLTYGDYVIRPKLTYAFSDQLKGLAGIDFYRGGATTFFGRLRDNSSIYTELKLSF